ncbi:MAG: DEAD/DEAH box helicase [Okeania sp. SIO2G4]|uniref:DEAD/DEAH box helicase n=1 Tax=unclassified Okeania TaxID=2634635 RepID=UPI0013B6D175|nr:MULTISPECIES: DEAD/DEAH box helicase [unclassified Okeania]NEP73890.1 DEAD/DEAH box helicase [Okeania sp. SIO2G5]NEP94703.1 DEAD/DEAH box helicase [Okeania sp. SIO2F5]NEQ92428.1 DEAD/DEAH box helicase [Okeania sp. SIO2G4]
MSYSTQNSRELDLKTLFPFELDNFQKEAIVAVNAGKSVVVCTPTGSGKTLIGEYAIYRALSRGRRVFYTTPLKALSNQKLRDFRDKFGADKVGLVTGDTSVNREASVLVMTTEVFRNMLYGTPIGEIGTSLEKVEAVVLDECHYMNDRQRGTVWEELIIYCPSEIQLLALSATVANSDQLTDWINKVHGPTELIYSDFRPVPLQFNFSNSKGLFPLLSNNQKRVNPLLKPKNRRIGRDRREKQLEPILPTVLSQLKERDMLPAIYFIFSRRGCDRAVAEIAQVSNLTLLDEAEATKLQNLIQKFLTRNPDLAHSKKLEPLSKGIAAHHAGMLPVWKGLVEELFQLGLIKVVFATETLAAGINMPARTTVISSLSKRTDEGHRLLKPSEFLQMAGRAGRRGMDVQGYVLTVQTRFEGAKEASYLATSGADPLVSQFTPSYGMVLNLLQTHTLEEAKELVERSFGQYLSSLSLEAERIEIEQKQAELTSLQNKLGIYEQNDLVNLEQLLRDYEKIRERVKEEKRLLKILQRQADENRIKEMSLSLSFALSGTIMSLKGKHVPTAKRSDAKPIAAALVAKIPGSGQSSYYVCLGKDNRWYVVAAMDVVGLHPDVPRLVAVEQMELPAEIDFRLGQCRKGDEIYLSLSQQIPEVPPPIDAPEVLVQMQKVATVEVKIQEHPLKEWGSPRILLKGWRRMGMLEMEIGDRQTELEDKLARHWQEFLNLIEILQYFGCLHEVVPTEIGQACAAIRGDNELWLGLALMSGVLDSLDPHHLAAACAALVTEISRPDSWSRYDLSMEVEDALGGLRSLRHQLFQVQRRYRVSLPVWLERDLISLVEQWALEVEWQVLVENTSLDEGDVVRILRRTLDFLSQIPHVPHLSDVLRRNAYRAMQLIDRFPVNEEVK